MAVSVTDGGNVTYWGDASVRSSVRRGGAVVRGTAAELTEPVVLEPRPPAPPRLVPPPPTPRVH